MLRRIDRRKARKTRKKPPKSRKKYNIDISDKLKSFLMTVFIWFLSFANLIIVVSFLFQSLKASQSDTIVPGKPSVAVNMDVDKPKSNLITVEVLNGCGTNKVAAQLRNYLIDKNVDVIDFKNYERFDIPNTIVIDRRHMDIRDAEKIADLIGVDEQFVFPQISPQRKLDVTIIIGADFLELDVFKKIFDQSNK